MTAILFLIFLAILSLVLWRMWMTGEITGFSPRTREERLRFYWLAIGAVNFLAFIAHIMRDGTCAFPSGGRLVGGYYLVPCHGRDIAFTPTGYAFSFWHGIIFVVIHLVCMFAMWRLRRTRNPKT
jgi:bacteriorhodopsin